MAANDGAPGYAMKKKDLVRCWPQRHFQIRQGRQGEDARQAPEPGSVDLQDVDVLPHAEVVLFLPLPRPPEGVVLVAKCGQKAAPSPEILVEVPLDGVLQVSLGEDTAGAVLGDEVAGCWLLARLRVGVHHPPDVVRDLGA